jgi:hypothetical protein
MDLGYVFYVPMCFFKQPTAVLNSYELLNYFFPSTLFTLNVKIKLNSFKHEKKFISLLSKSMSCLWCNGTVRRQLRV